MRAPSSASAWVGSVIVGVASTALSAILLPEDFWLGVLALCAVGAVWVIWHYIFVDCRRPIETAAQEPEQTTFWVAEYAEEQRREEIKLLAKREARRNLGLEDEV